MSDESLTDDLLGAFLADAIEAVLATEQRDDWLGWMSEVGRERYRTFFEPIPDENGRRVLSTYLALSFWSAMPLPRLGFAVDPDAIPNPAELCPCGSGSTYVDCCAAGPAPSPEMFDTAELWRALVSRLDEGRFARLTALDRIPDPALAPIGERLIASGRPAAAIELIEPRIMVESCQATEADGLPEPTEIDAGADAGQQEDRLQDALRTLLRAYESIDGAGGFDAVFERLDSRLPDPLRAMLWWIRAVSLADSGDLETARETLATAWRLAPNSPSLAPIEIMLTLVLQGLEPTRARARFLLARFRRAGFGEDEWATTFLRRATRDPLVAFSPQLGCSPEHAERLRRLIDRLDAPETLCYQFEGSEPAGSQWLVPPSRLVEIETTWSGRFPLERPYGRALLPTSSAEAWNAATAEGWIAFLEATPEALDSFEILDDLCLAIDELIGNQQGFESLHRSLLDPILERAGGMLTQLASSDPVPHLPWSAATNRSALRLAARSAVEVHRDDPMAASAAIERVLRLDPEDPFGLRNLLADAYLRSQANEDVLHLCDRFPGDHQADLLYGKVLALFRLQRMDAASEALAAALTAQPDAARFLLDGELGPPGPMTPRVEASAATKAWLYRRSAEDLWSETPGALSWLRGQQRRLATNLVRNPG